MRAVFDERVSGETLVEVKPRPIHDDAENQRQTALLERLTSLDNPTIEQRMVADLLVMLIEPYEERFRSPKASPLERRRYDVFRSVSRLRDRARDASFRL